jgi:uncharacterized protein with PQ loop repeat
MSGNESLRAMVIVANVIGFVYNVPQVILTIRTKSANDISLVFLSMRLLSALLWLIYSGIVWSPDVFISWVITGTSSGVLLYYKIVYSSRDQLCKEFVWKRENNAHTELKDVVTN